MCPLFSSRNTAAIKGFRGDTMIIPIFSNIIVMTFYTVLNIGIIIVSPLNPLFPYFLHHHCFQILYTTNFLRENVFYILFHSFFFNK